MLGGDIDTGTRLCFDCWGGGSGARKKKCTHAHVFTLARACIHTHTRTHTCTHTRSLSLSLSLSFRGCRTASTFPRNSSKKEKMQREDSFHHNRTLQVPLPFCCFASLWQSDSTGTVACLGSAFCPCNVHTCAPPPSFPSLHVSLWK